MLWSEADLSIHPTAEQLTLLAGPPSLASLKAADFLGRQSYIDEWIAVWLESSEWNPAQLPLCVSESIVTVPKIRTKYRRAVKAAIVRNDLPWLQIHCILPVESSWKVVNFCTVTTTMFEFLSGIIQAPLNLCPFVAASRNLAIWKLFVDEYGPDSCIEQVAQQQWYDGLKYCVEEGAELHDVVKHCVRSAALFRLVTLYNPRATPEAWREFRLQRMLSRVEDEALVEEWFFVHGYKTEYKNVF